MPRSNLAKELVAAKNATERNRLLQANRRLADEKLAILIKEICYIAWAEEPTKAQKAAAALQSLYKFDPSDETGAFFYWVSGISDITRGRLESAVDNLDRASEIFLRLGREQDSAQTGPAKLIALGLLGRYEEAVETGEAALKIFEKYGDELAAAKIETNLGNIVSRRELHARAEKYGLSARKRFIKMGETGWLIMAENGLAITYTQMNDFRKAEKFFTRALETARENGMLLTQAEIEASIGNLALFRGRYDEALKFLELSRRNYETLDMPHQRAVASLEMADIYRELNLTPEAFDIYAEVVEVFKKLKLQGEEARARANYGRAAIVLDKPAVARRELKRAARLYEREKNKTGAAAVDLIQARLEIERNDLEKAAFFIRESERLLNESESYRHKLGLKLLKAEVLDRTGERDAAAGLLSETLTEATRRKLPAIALAALNSLGKLALIRGERRSAKEYFRKAADLVESLRSPLAAEEFRMAFLANKLEPFENLAAIYLAENDLEKSFLTVERFRSRALVESVEDNALPVPGQDAGSGLNEDLSRLREELNWFYSRMRRAKDGEIGALQKETGAREKQIAVLMRRIESTREGAITVRSIDPARLRKQLGKKKTLVEYVCLDGVFSAFIVDDSNIAFKAGLAGSDEIIELLEGLQFQFGALRYGAAVPEKFMADLKKRADIYLEKLYEKLLKPIAAEIGGKDLVIVPADALYYVPFHALLDGENYLIESREVVYSPSAAVWLALREKPRRSVKKSLLMGFADESIPLVDREIDTLKKVMPGAKVYKGEAATFAAYTKNAPEFDLLHLACHAQFRPGSPLFSSLHLADGWVTVRDVCSQKLKARLVTLSACETGLNKIFAGDEILGLARGFLLAGAHSLIMSLWTVNDEAASGLMRIFYENLQRGKSIAASLRIAQMDFIGRGAHPYFWSPFALIGK
jgi:tetratricopeptide (TPR) repeat protein